MKLKKAILLVGIILTCPFALICGLLLFNSINPMQLAFITSFTVENQSGQDIWITPIGTRGNEGRKGRLPIFWTTLPALPSVKSAHYHLKQGQSINIKYDWDDVNFSEIAVKTEDGSLYEYIVDPNPLLNQYHAPESKHFAIPDIMTLQPSRSQIINVVRGPGRIAVQYIFIFGGGVLFLIFWRGYKKTKISSASEISFDADT